MEMKENHERLQIEADRIKFENDKNKRITERIFQSSDIKSEQQVKIPYK